MENKIRQAITLLRSYAKQGELILAFSGGKDSLVCWHLLKSAAVPFRAVYSNTTIDPPGTIAFVKSYNVEVIQPQSTFFQLIEKRGLPSFERRFCCEHLKEIYLGRFVVTGVRSAESQRRKKRYKEPTSCRLYTKKRSTEYILPILSWSDSDVEAYINTFNLRCHPLYYDTQGRFCVTRRLGCLGCPLPYNRSIDDFERFPHLLRAWLRALRVFHSTHPQSNALALFRSEYEQIANNIFYHSYNEFLSARDGLFPLDFHKALEERFSIEL